MKNIHLKTHFLYTSSQSMLGLCSGPTVGLTALSTPPPSDPKLHLSRHWRVERFPLPQAWLWVECYAYVSHTPKFVNKVMPCGNRTPYRVNMYYKIMNMNAFAVIFQRFCSNFQNACCSDTSKWHWTRYVYF